MNHPDLNTIVNDWDKVELYINEKWKESTYKITQFGIIINDVMFPYGCIESIDKSRILKTYVVIVVNDWEYYDFLHEYKDCRLLDVGFKKIEKNEKLIPSSSKSSEPSSYTRDKSSSDKSTRDKSVSSKKSAIRNEPQKKYIQSQTIYLRNFKSISHHSFVQIARYFMWWFMDELKIDRINIDSELLRKADEVEESLKTSAESLKRQNEIIKNVEDEITYMNNVVRLSNRMMRGFNSVSGTIVNIFSGAPPKDLEPIKDSTLSRVIHPKLEMYPKAPSTKEIPPPPKYHHNLSLEDRIRRRTFIKPKKNGRINAHWRNLAEPCTSLVLFHLQIPVLLIDNSSSKKEFWNGIFRFDEKFSIFYCKEHIEMEYDNIQGIVEQSDIQLTLLIKNKESIQHLCGGENTVGLSIISNFLCDITSNFYKCQKSILHICSPTAKNELKRRKNIQSVIKKMILNEVGEGKRLRKEIEYDQLAKKLDKIKNMQLETGDTIETSTNAIQRLDPKINQLDKKLEKSNQILQKKTEEVKKRFFIL